MLAVHIFEAYAGICYVIPDTCACALRRAGVLDQGQADILYFDFFN